jgi:hypothetical protein
LAASILLTLALTTVVAGSSWLLLGTRLELAVDRRQNELLNIIVYGAIALPFAFMIVMFAVERL